jgi:putative transcriptional regulator
MSGKDIALPADPNDPEDRDVTHEQLRLGYLRRDLRKFRASLGLSQAEFARQFGIPERTYENLEQGRRAPDGAMQSFLRVILAEPDTVRRVVAA